jgi:hypothetical protein
LGAGWNQPEPLYDHYFLPAKLTESAAIQMNDYLMLGATLGVPAFFCFGMYLWLTLKNYDKGFRLWALGSGPRNQSAENEGSSAKSDPSEREGNREMARGKAESVSSFILHPFFTRLATPGPLFCWWGSGLTAGCSNCPRRRRFGFCSNWARPNRGIIHRKERKERIERPCNPRRIMPPTPTKPMNYGP